MFTMGRTFTRFVMVLIAVTVVGGYTVRPRSLAAEENPHPQLEQATSSGICRKSVENSGIDAKWAPAFLNHGNAWKADGNLDQAIVDMTVVISLDLKGAQAFSKRDNVWQANGDLDKVIADMTEAIRLDPKNALTFVIRGIAWQAKGTSTKPSLTSTRPSGSTRKTCWRS